MNKSRFDSEQTKSDCGTCTDFKDLFKNASDKSSSDKDKNETNTLLNSGLFNFDCELQNDFNFYSK